MILSQPNRRAMLRATGVSLALPFFESLSKARDPDREKVPPLRLAFVYAPNGKHMPDWTPKTVGANFELTPILRPLEKVRQHVSVLSGLCHRNASAGDDGPGDHARAMATFLTGVRPKKTSGSDVRNGISVDQLAAATLGRDTRLSSLEVGCEGGKTAGICDNGYSCAYQTNLSWRGESTPMPKEVNPRVIFDRLFGDHACPRVDSALMQRDVNRRSILDFVAEDARELGGKLGGADRRKLDEYLTGVREVERRIQLAQPIEENRKDRPMRPTVIPENYGEYARLLSDLIVLAFRTDSTRVATFVLANDGSNRSYREVGISEGHHDISHHAGDPAKHEKLQRINQMHVSVLASFIEKLHSTREGDGSLLDQCLVIYGSGIRDGDRHDHDDLPVLLAGNGCGNVNAGHHIRYPVGTPLCNLYLSLLHRAGVQAKRFGDSTGMLKSIE